VACAAEWVVPVAVIENAGEAPPIARALLAGGRCTPVVAGASVVSSKKRAHGPEYPVRWHPLRRQGQRCTPYRRANRTHGDYGWPHWSRPI